MNEEKLLSKVTMGRESIMDGKGDGKGHEFAFHVGQSKK